MGDYSLWTQRKSKSGMILEEWLQGYFDTLSEAMDAGEKGDIVRYYDGCNGNWDWDNPDVVNGFYNEFTIYV